MIWRSFALFAAAAVPAQAASGPFFSLSNTDFIVTISFLIFVGAIIYFKAPQFAAKLLDGQIDAIRKQIETTSSLRRDADAELMLARKENAASIEQSQQIVEHAKQDALRLVQEAEHRIERTAQRRLEAAREQIASAEQAAVTEVRNEAIDIAVEVAAAEVAARMTESDRRSITERALEQIRTNIH